MPTRIKAQHLLNKPDFHEPDFYKANLHELDLHELDLHEANPHEPHSDQTTRSPVSATVSATVSVCGNCAEFLALERTPYLGNCLLHAVPISSWDKACSQYRSQYCSQHHSGELFQSGGREDDEF